MRPPTIADAKARRPVHVDGSTDPVGVVVHVESVGDRATVVAAGRHLRIDKARVGVPDTADNLPAVPEPVEPVDVVAAIRAAIAAADAEREAMATRGDYAGLARGLAQVRALKRDLGLLESTVVASLADVMPSRQVEVDGLGVVERARSIVRRWPDPAAVLAAVVRSAVDPDGTGEVPTDPVAVIGAITDAVLACAPLTPSTGWRLGALRERGIDPDAYAEERTSRWSVRLHNDGAGK